MMNEVKVLNFLREIVLTPSSDLSRELREQALDLLILSKSTLQKVTIPNRGVVMMPNDVYMTISEHIRLNQKINGIKALREWYLIEYNRELLGLKEAKDTIDNWV